MRNDTRLSTPCASKQKHWTIHSANSLLLLRVHILQQVTQTDTHSAS
jgi:hypothetical protein